MRKLLCILILICTCGCDMGMLPPTINYVEEVVKIGAERLEAHDENISAMLVIQTPLLVDKLNAQRTFFMGRMEDLDNRQAQADKVQEQAWQQGIENAAKIVGLPTILIEKLLPKIDAASDEAGEASAAVDALRTRVDVLKDSQLTPVQLEALKGMSTSELLALIVSIGGAAGAGVVSARSGKSRSHADVKKLEDTVSVLALNVERAKSPLKEG